MRRSTVPLAAVLSAALSAAVFADEAVRVWAAGDCVRVNPVTGKYFIDRPDIHPDYPTGDYARRNAVWDADAGRVTLHAARNEFVAFQVIVQAAAPTAGIQVRLDRLTGPGGAVLAGNHVRLMKEWYVQVKQRSAVFEKLGLGLGWYPDPLIPVDPAQAADLDIPDEKNAIGPTQTNQAIWVDLYVPRDRTAAPPGKYTGELTVAWPAGRQKLAVELNVWDFALPEQRHLRGDIWNSSLARMDPEVELAYYRMFRRHRFLPGVCYYRPQARLDGAKVQIDWAEYDRRLGRYIDGSAFTAKNGYWGPGEGVPIDHVILPFNCGRKPGEGWPVPLPEGQPDAEYEAAWRDAVRQFKAHFDRDPAWRAVGKVVFLGSLDEGYNERTYERIEYYSKLTASAAGNRWYQFRVDGGHNFATMARLQPYVDLWVMHTFSFNGDKMAHFREKGIEGWFYGDMIYEKKSAASGSNTYIDLDLLTCRGPGWAAWYHRAGFCSWEFDYHSKDAWTVAANFRHQRSGRHEIEGAVFNGSGLLIYPGEFLGSREPVASIRLKAHRRGFQDYEYFWLLTERTGSRDAADAVVRSIILSHPFGNPSHEKIEIWKNNPEAWDAARIRIGDQLATPP